MVQVDVFWAYGWGASLAAAAGQQLSREDRPMAQGFFGATSLFLSVIWAPTGMLLLLRHPSWETMQVAEDLSSMSEWLILAFGISNVLLGVLGYRVGAKLVRAQKWHLAQLNWIAGYIGMFFILLYGWDGLGYDRFLYDRDLIPGSPAWAPGAGTGAGVLPALLAFFGSTVAKTLYLDGAFLLPPFFWLAARWIRQGRREANHSVPSSLSITASYLLGVFVIGFGCAAVAALTVRGVASLIGVPEHLARGLGAAPANTSAHVLSYVLGLPLALAVLWYAVLRPGGPASRLLRPLLPPRVATPPEPSELSAAPVANRRALDPKHILVTGGAGRIGFAIARRLAAQHPEAHLTLMDVDLARLDACVAELGPRARGLAWDLSAVEDFEPRWASEVESRGPVELLVNCAGQMEIRSFGATGWELGARLLAINFTSPMRLMQLSVKRLLEERREGAVINVCSMAALVPIRGCTWYGGAKAGLALASEIASLELRERGIHVTTVYPGPVFSPLEARARSQVEPGAISRNLPTGDAEEIAAEIVAAHRHRRSRVVYPAFYRLAYRFPSLSNWVTSTWSPHPRE